MSASLMPSVRRLSRVFMSLTRPQVQALEARQLYAVTSPLLTTIHVDGSVHKITAVVLHFDEAINPATSTNANSYIFGKIPPPDNSSSDITLGDVLGFLSKRASPNIARPTAVRSQAWVKLGKIQWSSISYDNSTHAVTLVPVKDFNGATFFHMLRVKGTGQFAIKDMQGLPFAGGNDAVMKWQYRNTKSLNYSDKNGDRVSITIKGKGTLSTFLRRAGNPRPVILVSGADAKSVITGKVVRSPNGTGTTAIDQFSGLTMKNNILGNAQFIVLST
jgi:hypothetical protein